MMGFLLLIFAIWRVGLFFAAFIADKVLVFAPRFPYSEALLIPSNLPSWIWSFANFDGVHYITIAKSGYSAQFTQVFFPLYPIFVRFSSLIFDNSYIVGGLVISNASFGLVLYLFAKLLKHDNLVKSRKWTVLFLVTFPFSFFFGSLYTESFFLGLVLVSFLAARKKKWMWAGIFASLASATRFIGIFLLPALLWEQYGSDIKYQIVNIKSKNQISKIVQVLTKVIGDFLKSPITYLAPVGLVSYMVYLQWKFNDFLYFWHVQPVFGAQRSGSSIVLPPQVLWRYAKILASISFTKYDFWVGLWELLAFLTAISLLLVAHRKKVRLSYLIFAWFAVLVPTLTGTLSSMPRYILIAFPMYMVLGQVKSTLLKSVLIAAQVVLLAIFAGLFVQGRWIG